MIDKSVAPDGGRREKKKLDKMQRIRAAATSLFHKRGYRETTVQAIAAAAKVSPGTVFLYAADKRDLLLQIINAELELLTGDAFGDVDHEASVLDQLIHVFGPRYDYWGVDPTLSLTAMQEVLVAQPGDEQPDSEYARYQQRSEALLVGIRNLLAEQQRRGRVRTDDDPALLAEMCMMIHIGVIRWWLHAAAPATASATRRLRSLLGLAIRGSLVDAE